MNHQTTNAFRMSLVIALFTLLHSAVQGEPAPPAAVVQINEAEQVGRSDDGRAMTPVNQILTPYGK